MRGSNKDFALFLISSPQPSQTGEGAISGSYFGEILLRQHAVTIIAKRLFNFFAGVHHKRA